MSRTQYVSFRCTDQERQALERIAAERGQNLSETLRRAVRAEAQRAGVRVAQRGDKSNAND